MTVPDHLPKPFKKTLASTEVSTHERSQTRRYGQNDLAMGIGRKNWLFAGADTGAETLARAMTVIETVKMNGLDPQA